MPPCPDVFCVSCGTKLVVHEVNRLQEDIRSIRVAPCPVCAWKSDISRRS